MYVYILKIPNRKKSKKKLYKSVPLPFLKGKLVFHSQIDYTESLFLTRGYFIQMEFPVELPKFNKK